MQNTGNTFTKHQSWLMTALCHLGRVGVPQNNDTWSECTKKDNWKISQWNQYISATGFQLVSKTFNSKNHWTGEWHTFTFMSTMHDRCLVFHRFMALSVTINIKTWANETPKGDLVIEFQMNCWRTQCVFVCLQIKMSSISEKKRCLETCIS